MVKAQKAALAGISKKIKKCNLTTSFLGGHYKKTEPVLPPINNTNQIGDIGGLKYSLSVMNFIDKGIALLKIMKNFVQSLMMTKPEEI